MRTDSRGATGTSELRGGGNNAKFQREKSFIGFVHSRVASTRDIFLSDLSYSSSLLPQLDLSSSPSFPWLVRAVSSH